MILFLFVLGILLYLAEKYSMLHVLDGVELETTLDKALVEPGEEFAWTMTITNGKRLMVPYLKVKESVPDGLKFWESGEDVEEKKEGRTGHRTVLYLAGRQRAELCRSVMLEKRGRYFFHGASLEAGDFLGARTVLDSRPELKEIVVKPKAWEREGLRMLLGGYLGDFPEKNSLFEDPVLTLGFREYTGREPFRSISWTQSARYGRFLVKQQERMADLSCTILLGVPTEGASERKNYDKRRQDEKSLDRREPDKREPDRKELDRKGPDRKGLDRKESDRKGRDGKRVVGKNSLEQCFSMVRSVCEELEERKIPYDFQTNGMIAGTMGSWNQVLEGLGDGHLETVLEGLGRMTYDARESMEAFLFRIQKGIRPGKSIIFIAPRPDENVQGLLQRLEERSGRKLLFLYAEEEEE